MMLTTSCSVNWRDKRQWLLAFCSPIHLWALWWNWGRSILFFWRPGWHLPPRSSLIKCPGSATWVLAEDASYTLFLWREFDLWGRQAWNILFEQLLDNTPASLVLRHLNNSSSPESIIVLILLNIYLASQLSLSSRSCVNIIISIKMSLNQERLNLSDSYSHRVLFIFCLVLISLCLVWWGWQWYSCQGWYC